MTLLQAACHHSNSDDAFLRNPVKAIGESFLCPPAHIVDDRSALRAIPITVSSHAVCVVTFYRKWEVSASGEIRCDKASEMAENVPRPPWSVPHTAYRTVKFVIVHIEMDKRSDKEIADSIPSMLIIDETRLFIGDKLRWRFFGCAWTDWNIIRGEGCSLQHKSIPHIPAPGSYMIRIHWFDTSFQAMMVLLPSLYVCPLEMSLYRSCIEVVSKLQITKKGAFAVQFPDYISILKKHFKKSISVEELCRILFDSIIIPANLTDSHGETLDIDKAEISRIMNHKKNISVQLQDHVYDDNVLAGMNTYFQDNIVSELVPDPSDLIHQMLQLIDADSDISSAHRASLHIQASPATFALFLADVFVYVVRKENKATSTTEIVSHPTEMTVPTRQEENVPQITLCGITDDGEISDTVSIADFCVRDKYSVDEYEEKIGNYYEQISKLRCTREEPPSNQAIMNLWGLSGILQNMMPYEDISEPDKSLIRGYAAKKGIRISDDFFSLGNLRRMNTLSLTETEYLGTENEKKKYELLKTLPDYIKRYQNLKCVARALSDVLCIRLAISNTGTSVAEDVRIRLKIDASTYFDADDMAGIGNDALRLIFDDYSCDDIFGIDRTANYLDYDSSLINVAAHRYIRPNIPLYFEKRDFAEEWSNYLPYFIEKKGNDILLDLQMDEVMHHTVVAFPTVLLFKEYTPSIEYVLSCRQMTEMKTGTLKITQA